MVAGHATLALVISITPALAAATDPRDGGIPALAVRVSAAPSISPAIVDRMLEEASAIWRPAGVRFEWHRDARQPLWLPVSVASIGPRVIIGDSRGALRENGAPLGWVTFTGEQPDGDIHISHRNAEHVILPPDSSARAGRRITPAERTVLIGRALGRALAHELGHYLLKSKVHTTNGLMKGRRTVKEFVDATRERFEVLPADRDAVVRRIREASESYPEHFCDRDARCRAADGRPPVNSADNRIGGISHFSDGRECGGHRRPDDPGVVVEPPVDRACR